LKAINICCEMAQECAVDTVNSVAFYTNAAVAAGGAQYKTSAFVSANLWSVIRARGCQFLGPAMQVMNKSVNVFDN
jgi:hypothetical protein